MDFCSGARSFSATLVGAALSLAILAGCASATAEQTVKNKPSANTPITATVLVVGNLNSLDSMKIANYYVQKRKIPPANLVKISTITREEIPAEQYKTEIENKVRAAIKASPTPIDYIVLTRGIPIRIGDIGGYSVDATLAGMDLTVAPIKQKVGAFGLDDDNIERCESPYFNKFEKFSHKKFGLYLVTRLTGYTAEDAMALVDNSLNAKRETGPFLLDSQPMKPRDGGYGMMETLLSQAADLLTMNGMDVEYDINPKFVSSDKKLMGYASWGSNDDKFDLKTYNSLKFKPGAIVETFVSTSARTFEPTKEGQSLIADLVKQGATGAKGYVSEPYTFALCKVQILFDRYTKGYNLAESYYMSTPLVKWKDMVIGDPLCSPYKKK